ncbi:MAG TPA: hypothetical protein VLR54_05245 [Methanobacteriaceae archaeon]|nr:hypothetical protein [Methanobacteriaceae archaeon]
MIQKNSELSVVSSLNLHQLIDEIDANGVFLLSRHTGGMGRDF